MTASRFAVCSAGLYQLSSVINCDDEKAAFSPKEFRSFKIREIKTLSHNTKQFVCELPTPEHQMGMPTASFVMVKGPTGADGKPTLRPYTPVSTNDHKGDFDLVVKTYPNGIVSGYLHSLKVGDSIEVKGPITKFKYVPNSVKHIGMLAGGSGITPMLQVVKEIVNNPEDYTTVHLVFANNTTDDILLRKEIDELAAKHNNLKISYVVAKLDNRDRVSFAGNVYEGYVSEKVIADTMPAPSSDSRILVCGPPGFMDAVSGNKTPDYQQGLVSGLLKKAGYNETMVFKF